MKLLGLGLIVTAVATGLGIYAFTRVSSQARGGQEEAIVLSVTVAPVQRKALPLLLSATGRVEAKASVAIKARVDGQVAEIAFAEGQPVRKGQLLVLLDPAQAQTQLNQAEGVLARDEAQLKKLRNDFQRNQALVGQGFLSASGMNQSEADVQSALAAQKTDRAILDGARLQLAYTRITAPMDGVAGAVLLPAGSAVKANDTSLLVINQIKPIYVSFSLSESQLPALKLAMTKGTVPVQTTVGSDHVLTGKLTFIDNAVDPTSGAITVKAIFDNADGLLTPGAFAIANVQMDQLADAVVVPSQAVESGLNGPYAFVVKADATVELRQLKVGAQSGGLSVVSAGLAPGEQVVTSGQARLRDKAKVSIQTAADNADNAGGQKP